VQCESNLYQAESVVPHSQLLVTDPLPEKLLLRDMERAERSPYGAVAQEVWIGEGNSQLSVLVPYSRIEEERPAPL
jgi:hypothetical protein